MRGSLENISLAPLLVRPLGIILPVGGIEYIDDSATMETWRGIVPKLKVLVGAGNLDIKDRNGVSITSGGLQEWINLEWGVGNSYLLELTCGHIGSSITEPSVWMDHEDGGSHKTLGFLAPQKLKVRTVLIVVNAPDVANQWSLKLHADPMGLFGGPYYINTPVTLEPGSMSGSVTDLSLILTAGYYGLTLDRTTGEAPSAFTEARVKIFVEPLYF